MLCFSKFKPKQYDELGLVRRQGLKSTGNMGHTLDLCLDDFLFGVADVGPEGFVFLVDLWMLVRILEDTSKFHALF